jgi:hypothetical protein
MKKMILTLAVAFTAFSAFAGSAISKPKAADVEEEVSQKVINAFKSEFSNAGDVSWTASTEYYKAAFTYNGKHVFAYYNTEGELLALTRYLSSEDLPLNLISPLKKKYSEYWISDLFEVAKTESTVYFVTLENADTKLILKASGNGWVVHQKEKKA